MGGARHRPRWMPVPLVLLTVLCLLCTLSTSSALLLAGQRLNSLAPGAAVRRGHGLDWEGRTGRGRVMTMKAVSGAKKRMKKQRAAASLAAAAAAASGGGAPARVDPTTNISVRTQQRWGKINKALRDEAAGGKTSFRQTNNVPRTSYRKEKGAEPDYVELPDLSKVKVTKVNAALMVDGYNIVHYWPKLKKRLLSGRIDEARDMLVAELGELGSMRGWDVTCVFDAQFTNAETVSSHHDGFVDTVFTSKGMEADAYIEAAVMRLHHKQCPSIMIATDDNTVSSVAMGCGALCISAKKLVQEINVAKKEAMHVHDTFVKEKEEQMGSVGNTLEAAMDADTKEKMDVLVKELFAIKQKKAEEEKERELEMRRKVKAEMIEKELERVRLSRLKIEEDKRRAETMVGQMGKMKADDKDKEWEGRGTQIAGIGSEVTPKKKGKKKRKKKKKLTI